MAEVTADTLLTVPEVAARLGVDGRDVYELIFSGRLAGAPQLDGAVYVPQRAVDALEADRHHNRPSSR